MAGYPVCYLASQLVNKPFYLQSNQSTSQQSIQSTGHWDRQSHSLISGSDPDSHSVSLMSNQYSSQQAMQLNSQPSIIKASNLACQLISWPAIQSYIQPVSQPYNHTFNQQMRQPVRNLLEWPPSKLASQSASYPTRQPASQP